MNLGTVGVDALMDSMAGAELAQFARKIEKLGYSALWFPEAFGRDPFALAAHLLTVTEKLIVGTAIANVWKREPVAMLSGARTLAEMFPGRFVLGIGISHGPMMTRVNINYAKPLTFMRDYLARMKDAPYGAARPSSEAPIVVAALLPKMLQLAAAETDGTIPAFVTPERTAQIRAEIGPDKLICVQQISMLEPDASKARTAIRGLIAFYLGLPNYLQSLRLMGFDDSTSPPAAAIELSMRWLRGVTSRRSAIGSRRSTKPARPMCALRWSGRKGAPGRGVLRLAATASVRRPRSARSKRSHHDELANPTSH